jgi:hypothetical protein
VSEALRGKKKGTCLDLTALAPGPSLTVAYYCLLNHQLQTVPATANTRHRYHSRAPSNELLTVINSAQTAVQ